MIPKTFAEAIELYHENFDESYLRRALEIDEERLLELVSDSFLSIDPEEVHLQVSVENSKKIDLVFMLWEVCEENTRPYLYSTKFQDKWNQLLLESSFYLRNKSAHYLSLFDYEFTESLLERAFVKWSPIDPFIAGRILQTLDEKRAEILCEPLLTHQSFMLRWAAVEGASRSQLQLLAADSEPMVSLAAQKKIDWESVRLEPLFTDGSLIDSFHCFLCRSNNEDRDNYSLSLLEYWVRIRMSHWRTGTNFLQNRFVDYLHPRSYLRSICPEEMSLEKFLGNILTADNIEALRVFASDPRSDVAKVSDWAEWTVAENVSRDICNSIRNFISKNPDLS